MQKDLGKMPSDRCVLNVLQSVLGCCNLLSKSSYKRRNATLKSAEITVR